MKLKGLAVWVLAAAAFAQEPMFEVASVKASNPKSVRGSEGGPGSKDPTRYRFQVATLMDLIVTAYHVHGYQVSSRIPLEKDNFDLEAKLPEGATREQFREMMQALLAERFHLKVHMESREFAGYALTVGPSGPRFHVEEGADFPPLPGKAPAFRTDFFPRGRYAVVRARVRQEPVSMLAENIEMWTHQPVADQTALDGRYDFTLMFATDLPGTAAPETTDPEPTPDLFKAIRQMGLVLTAKKLPFNVVVVDSVDKAPVGN
jgi:uncharacterized protein (TIGR03435 family)